MEHKALLKGRSSGCTGCVCHEFCLLLLTQIPGQVGKGRKKGNVCSFHHLQTLGTRAASPVIFPRKAARRREAMDSGVIFRGNMRKTQGFNTIFRGVKGILYPLALPQVVECTYLS